MNIESAAINILKRGVELDTKKRYTESLVCYQEGLQILVDKIKNEPDEATRGYLRKKVEEYMSRAETIKRLVLQQKDAGLFHEQVHIENNSTGHGYKTLFGRFLDEDVQYVIVEDPYIRSFHQCQNFLRLCELLVRSCPNMRHIELITSKDARSEGDQREWFTNLGNDLTKYKVRLVVKYSETLHDRQITLSTGWIIKIGRGLDFFKAPDNKFCLGVYDMDLRPCHETTVDIVHSKNVKQSYG
ncbi:MIT domain-containing protein 1-like [Pectinophora gossypiella]|uniref:MIT domain-containing protein 1-like n=1 Tax=Pectinophora gossypiella TaxID=13191 RepID=UPI00214F1F9C|nr:MIT domain-containing protein 1-like [Pectinophora gossypiella]